MRDCNWLVMPTLEEMVEMLSKQSHYQVLLSAFSELPVVP